MSSAGPIELLRSATFRQTFLFFFLVVTLTCGCLYWIIQQISNELDENAIAEIDEMLEDVLLVSRIGNHGFEGLDFDDAPWHEPLELELEEGLGMREALDLYTEQIEHLLEDETLDDVERMALQARLAFLGETDDSRRLPIRQIAPLVFEEFPEEHHDLLDTLVERHEERDPAPFKEAPRPRSQQVLEWAEDRDWLEEEHICLRLVSSRSRVLASNFEPESEPTPLQDALQIRTTPTRDPFDEEFDFERRLCLVKTLDLLNGKVWVGVDFTEAHERKVRLWRVFLFALFFGLLLSCFASFRVARAPLRFLRDLQRARRRLTEGDFSPRLRRDQGGDFGLAVDEVNAMLEKLERSIRSLSQVTDNIAHDLRTPLTRLQGQLDLLKRHPHPEEGLIEAVQEEADHLIATFNALLRIAQVESGSRRQGFRVFDLTQVVDDVGELYAPVFGDKETDFHCRAPDTETWIHGDSDLWMQALSNLLDNAFKYGPEGGSVHLSLSLSSSGNPTIELRDNGPGIPEAELENVFQRFYRLPRHRSNRGNGLGLSLVQAICELHRAEIELRNEGGLVVRITFLAAR